MPQSIETSYGLVYPCYELSLYVGDSRHHYTNNSFNLPGKDWILSGQELKSIKLLNPGRFSSNLNSLKVCDEERMRAYLDAYAVDDVSSPPIELEEQPQFNIESYSVEDETCHALSEDLSSDIITTEQGELVIDSRIVAQRFNIQHKNLLEGIRKYLAEFEELGKVAFTTEALNSGQTSVFCYLNSKQVAYVAGIGKNTHSVRHYLLQYIELFDQMHKRLYGSPRPSLLTDVPRTQYTLPTYDSSFLELNRWATEEELADQLILFASRCGVPLENEYSVVDYPQSSKNSRRFDLISTFNPATIIELKRDVINIETLYETKGRRYVELGRQEFGPQTKVILVAPYVTSDVYPEMDKYPEVFEGLYVTSVEVLTQFFLSLAKTKNVINMFCYQEIKTKFSQLLAPPRLMAA